MAERRVAFADWVGKAVAVESSSRHVVQTYGQLEEVNDWGLVLRHRTRVTWPSAESPEESHDHQDWREVSEFRPWHTVGGVRVLEPEEKEGHDL
jgi:hypothetical protein